MQMREMMENICGIEKDEKKKPADRFLTFVFWSYFLCFLQIGLNTTSTKNSQTGISLLQDTKTLKLKHLCLIF